MNTDTFYIETYGCQMNMYDSLIAQKILEEQSLKKSDSIQDAQYILLNTCAIRENAFDKVYNKIHSIQHLKEKGKKIIVLGCMTQNLKKDILKKNQYIDYIFGPDELKNLKYIIHNNNFYSPSQRAFLELSKTELYEDVIPDVRHHLSTKKGKKTAFISIQRGCNNFCSFCVVPFTRGRERSRNPQSIILEIQKLEESGFQSVVLLGQNVNSYLYNKKINFTNLIEMILEKTKISRIYFTSPHPKDFPLELIHLMAREDRFCNHVHLPLQSGSNAILKKMRRSYTKEKFLEIVQMFRENVDDVAISTDVIVGFPSETEKQFKETIQVMEDANFDSAFMFAYSERKNTLAKKKYLDDIPQEMKKKRLKKLIDNQLQRSFQNNQKYIDQDVKVLVEGISNKNPNEMIGRMTNGRKVIFPLDFLNSDFSKENNKKEYIIRIESVSSMTLKGKILTTSNQLQI